MVDRTSRLKLVIDATKAVASVERLNSSLIKLGQTAKSISSAIKDSIPGDKIAASANKASSAIRKLAGSLGGPLKVAINSAFAGLKKLGGFVGGKLIGVLKNVANFIKNTVVEALRALTRNALRALGLFAASLVHVQVEMDKFHSIMTLSSKGADGSAKVFRELASAANTFGLTLEGNLMKEFTKFRTVMVQAGIEGKEFMNIFGNFSQVANVFHLGSQDMQFAILALTQMVSKGKVSMEEMRRQLAERLPGTMQVAAKAFNTTTRELELAITKGFVDPVILIQGMMEEFARITQGASLKAVMSMEARLGRLSNGFFEIKRVLLSSGVSEALVGFFEQVQNLINYAIDSGAMEKLGKTISNLGNSLIGFFSDTPRLKAWFSDFAENWGAIMMGAGMKFLRFFGEGLGAVASDFWNGLDFSVGMKKATISDGVWDNLAPEGSGKRAFQDLRDKLFGGASTQVFVPTVTATYSGIGSTAFDSFAAGWESSFERSKGLFDSIGKYTQEVMSPTEKNVFKNVLRRAEGVQSSDAPAVIRSQLNQVMMFREQTREMLKELGSSDAYTPDAAESILEINVALQQQIDRLGEMVQVVPKVERQLSDLQKPQTVNMWAEMDKELKNLSGTLSSDFVSGLMEGEFAFQSFANSIVEAMMRVVAEALIMIPIMNALRAAMGTGQGYMASLTNGGFGTFASSPGGTGLPTGVTAAPTMFPEAGAIAVAAKGIVAGRGGLTAFAKGGVVNSPTMFKMKNGAGLMGEAGPEAVMPLARDSNGRLGVRGGGGGSVENNITIVSPKGFEASTNETENASGGMDTEILFRQIEGKIADRVSRRQGALFKTLQQGGHKGVLS